MFLMQLGEVAPGGVGTGIYSILMFAILGVFIAGLMIGRTPEYLGKKIETLEMKLASVFILTTPFVVLIGTAVAVLTDAGKAGIVESGRSRLQRDPVRVHLGGQQQRQRLRRLSAGSVFYNVSLGLAMFIGRYWPIMAALAIAGSLAQKKRVPVTEGTMPTHGPLFVALSSARSCSSESSLRPRPRTRAPRRALHARRAAALRSHMSRRQLPLFDRISSDPR